MARSILLALAAAAATAGGGVAAQRTEVSIDFGWRFAPVATPPCDYSVSLDGIFCTTMWSAPNGTASADACAAAACAEAQPAWNFCPGGAGSACGATAQCLVGGIQSCNPQSGWVGGARNFSVPPPANAPYAARGYDDSSMAVVDLPHDAVIANAYSEDADKGQGFLPVGAYLYRKHFYIPSEWQGSAITLVVDGALSTSTWWLNGQQVVASKQNGYLPLILRIDNLGVPLSYGAENVLAVYIDGSATTGWWYEGAGLTRNARLVVTNATAYIAQYGVAAPHFVLGDYHANGAGTPAEGLFADMGVVAPRLDVYPGAVGTPLIVNWTLYDAQGVAVATNGTVNTHSGGPGNVSTVAGAVLYVPQAQLWSLPRPYLYTLSAVLSIPKVGVVDAVNASIGIRSIAWDPEQGFKLNEQDVKIRGFCNHENWAGVGAAIAPRIDLHRLQQLRGVGGNGWRTSHNPAETQLYDLADRLGAVILSENRVLATNANCPDCNRVPSEYNGDPVIDSQLMATRDRIHPSVHSYSLCNEAGCGDGSLLSNDLVLRMKEAIVNVDGTRAVSANMGWLSPVTPGTAMSDVLDVMGMSHAWSSSFNTFHNAEPGKPLVANECCSCETQRGEDADQPRNTSQVFYPDENSACLTQQVSVADNSQFVAGQYIWTLHDYYGEPDAWPHISSSFGSFDLAGFPKSPVDWYRSRWLGNISMDDAGRPPLANTSMFIRIVESWAAPAKGGNQRTIHVYTNAPYVQLSVNGFSAGAMLTTEPNAYVVAANVTYAPGTLTAQAIAADGSTVLATHSVNSWGAPAAIQLSLDAPSMATGTGSKLFLDGQDVALVRATIVDAQGNVCQDSTLNVSFGVVGGPAVIVGVGNGNPSDHSRNDVSWRSAYHGLVRAVVRTSLAAAGSDADRALLATVNVEAGKSALASAILPPGGTAPTSMTITASAPGLSATSISIQLSTDPADGVLAVAAASVALADLTD